MRAQRCLAGCTAATLLLLSGFATRVDAQNSLQIDNVFALPGASVSVPVLCTNDVPLHAFSIALVHPPEVDFGGMAAGIDFAGSVVEMALGGSTPDIFLVEYDPTTSELTVGVILQVSPFPPPAAIPVSITDQLLMSLNFEVPVAVNPGLYSIDFVNGLGTPPVDNVFSSMGNSIYPTLASGSIDVGSVNSLSIPDQSVAIGPEFDLFVESTHTLPLQTFQITITYDSSELECLGASGRSTDAAEFLFANNPMLAAGGEPYELFFTGSSPIPGTQRASVSFAGIVDAQDEVMLPPAEDFTIVRFRFRTLPGAVSGAATEVEFDPSPGANFVVYEGITITTVTDSALVTYSSAIDIFRRGDVNSDGTQDIVDVVYLSKYAFAGSAPLPCPDAADVNDDGALDGNDFMHLLGYLFGGVPYPAQPFAICGADPTPDVFGCAGYTAACP